MQTRDPPPTGEPSLQRSTSSPSLADGSLHPHLPERPASTPAEDGGAGASKHAPRRDGGKVPLPPAASDLREKFMVQKHKLAEKKEQLKQKTKPPGGFDPTPLPDAPPGYTLRFIFHRAWNLPVGDFHLKSADPYLHATLTAAVPRRHKEDPLLTHRTRTLRRTTEPAWEDEWVVANVPASGFTLKCRLYDEDWPDHDDRFGNVTIRVPYVDEHWEGLGPDGRVFDVKKRAGSKRAYLVKGAASVLCRAGPITPRLHVSIKVLGKSAPPHAQMYTVGPTTFVKHYSPMIGRLTGVKVNKDEQADAASPSSSSSSAPKKRDRRTKKYDFQANEIQFSGPVPPRLYHRYVEFRPMIGRMFSSRGLRGRILHKVLHKQHNRIYNFDASTEYGTFAPCSEAATLQFLRMAHFDEGGRIFTYVLTLDGMMRFTETGKEFGIDLLSKHTMHSDVAVYVACAGEFFIRRLARPVDHHPDQQHHHHRHHHHHGDNDEGDDSHHQTHDSKPNSSTNKPHHPHTPSTHTHPPPEPPDPTANHPPTHPPHQPAGGPPSAPPPPNPRLYQLIIDNDSGTYRPDAAVLPDLRGFLARNLPGLDVAALHCADPRLADLKRAQREAKRRAAGGGVAVALGKKKKKRRSRSSISRLAGGGCECVCWGGSGSVSDVDSAASSAESRLGRMEAEAEEEGARGGTGAAGAGAAAAAGGGAAVRSKRERVFDVVSEPGRWREALGLRASRQGQAAGRA